MRSDFVNCVDNLYRQDFIAQHQHTTSDYLERVEKIKEEVTRPRKLARDGSQSSYATLNQDETEAGSGNINTGVSGNIHIGQDEL